MSTTSSELPPKELLSALGITNIPEDETVLSRVVSLLAETAQVFNPSCFGPFHFPLFSPNSLHNHDMHTPVHNSKVVHVKNMMPIIPQVRNGNLRIYL